MNEAQKMGAVAPRRVIEVPESVRKDIMKAFGVSRATLWRALNYQSDSEDAVRIRIYAKLRGCPVLNVTREAETLHDAAGMMRQSFENGALLEVDKSTGTVTVYDRSGLVAVRREAASLTELAELQGIAEGL